MSRSSPPTSFWRRPIEGAWILHPVVLFLLLGLALYASWYIDEKFARYIAGGLSFVLLALLARFYYVAIKIRKAITEVECERDRAWSPQVESERMQFRQVLQDVSRSTGVHIPAPSQKPEVADLGTGRQTIYVRGIQLENIRCFRHFELALEDAGGPCLTTILLGDNAVGKTTILRSIALGLCPESNAISLMKTLPGSFLREGAQEGSILLHLRSADHRFEGSLCTKIERTASGEQEVVRQITDPIDFPWHQIFVCGYGTQRTSERPSSHERYDVLKALATLFSNSADLLNPEVVLLRRDTETRSRLSRILEQILLLEPTEGGVRTSNRGIELGGRWGSQPLSVVSDGYRSTSQWVLDYLGWQLFADRFAEDYIDGILLIDELEQHLHPRWQRYFVQRLRAQLGQTQIIATSHTPLLAAGVADVDKSQVVRLIPTKDGSVNTVRIPPDELTGKRADQILADAFGLATSKSPGSVAKIDRYTELLSTARSKAEDKELETIKKEMEAGWSSGDHAVQRAADKAVSKVLDEMIDQGLQGVDVHVKHRLAELFCKQKEG